MKREFEDFTDAALHIRPPMRVAVGLEAIEKAMLPALAELGAFRTAKLSATINHKRGFDCPSCAWANPDHSKALEFCENGLKNVVWDSTKTVISDDFWAAHGVTELRQRSEYWLGRAGRIGRPVHRPAGSDHYRPISWEDALDLIANSLASLNSPNEAVFYTSGRIMNEPAFLIQLFARAFGTNNLPDCNNLCHQATTVALERSIGIGKSTVCYDDFAKAELIIMMGHNPGTNHPRMLDALQQAKANGAQIVAVNPLPEASLIAFRNPQNVANDLGTKTTIADQFLQLRSGGDQHLLQAIAKRVFAAEAAAPGTVLDHDFLEHSTEGLAAYRAQVLALDDAEVALATGLSPAQIDEVADRYLRSNATIITWALGLTQQRRGVPTIADVVNLLLLRGNIGKPGAGPSPLRGHSNVQGERTMGITEAPPEELRSALQAEYGFTVPSATGLDSVATFNALGEGKVKILLSFAGNLVAAINDTELAYQQIQAADLSVSVATKLNRSHVVTGAASLILPALTREERDEQLSGEQFTTSEDTVARVNRSHGELDPITDQVRSEVWVVCELGKRLLPGVGIDWDAYQADYDAIRDAIARVIPGFADFNARIRNELSFLLPDPPRDTRSFPTASGKAQFQPHPVELLEVPAGRLVLQTLRAHDQHNSSIYGLDDRYRGVFQGRFVILINPDDLAALGLTDGQCVDVFSEWPGEPDRVLRGYRAVSYPSARGCAAMYFPEANVLVPRASVEADCHTPTSKQVIVRVAPGAEPVRGSVPLSR